MIMILMIMILMIMILMIVAYFVGMLSTIYIIHASNISSFMLTLSG